MFLRQATAVLLKQIRRPSQLRGATTPALSALISCKTRYSVRYEFEGWRGQHGGLIWILISGQAALLFGIGSCPVLAEDISNRATSSTDVGVSDIAGLQRIEDGSVVSNEHTSKWRIYTDNGRDYFLQGKLDEAERFFFSAIEEAKKGFGERDPHVASACNNLAELYRVRRAYDKAEPLYRDAINMLEESFGPEDVRVGAAFHNLGQFYLAQRKFEEARICYERALKIKGRVLGLGHPDYADTMFHLGTVLNLQGNGKDGEALIQDSIRILEEGGQGESPVCIRRLRYLAQIYVTSNRLEEAENVQRKILHIMELTKGWNSLDTVIAAESLTMTLQSIGNVKDARDLLERCLDVRKTLLPEDHIQIGANMLSLARVAMLNSNQLRKAGASEATKELDRATDLLINSIRIARNVLDEIKQKKSVRRYRPHEDIGNDGRAALLILLQSLNALARLEVAEEEFQGTREASPGLEVESVLRQCISAFKEYGTLSFIGASAEVKTEYLSCLKHLLNLLLDDQTKKTDKKKIDNVEELTYEIKRIQAEVLQNSRRQI